MEMKIPTWLDACFVQKVLRKAENDESIEVSSIILKPATAKGDNYSSDMHRVTAELSRIQNGERIAETISVIAKVVPSVGGTLTKAVLGSGIFETEISMMVEVLPTMNRMMAELSMTSLSARCLQSQYDNPIYLIIEDLAPRGFRMAERRAGLDLDHSLLAMRNIAAFHAASVALAEKDPKVMRYVPWYSKGKDQFARHSAYINRSTIALGEEVANWPELSPRISKKITNLSDVIPRREWEAITVEQDDFNVLNHGDCSLNNMLFRYDEHRKPIEQIFVDFQTCRYGSPAYDIFYFFGSSLSVDVRLDDRDLLLREYHDSLTSTMSKLKCNTKTPSFEDLQDVLRKRAFYEVMPSFTTLAHALVDRSEATGSENLLTTDGKPDHPAFRGKIYRKIMTRVLPFFEGMGLLEA